MLHDSEVEKMRNVTILAVALLFLGIVPVLAADSPTVISIPNPDTVPATLDLGFFANIVTVGHQDPNVLPCFNCVSGASQVNLGIAVPLSVVHQGTAQNITVTGQNVSYSGPCTFSFAIRASVTSAPILTGSTAGSCYPAVWAAWFPVTIPNAPGRYLLQGEIQTRGAKTVIMAGLLITP
jgi:hypothetical protein